MLLAAIPTALLMAVTPLGATPTSAFIGYYHQVITENALPSWQKSSLAAMADQSDGAVVADDHGTYFDLGPLHCDNGDYLHAKDYPKTREQATTEIIACIRGSIARFRNAVAFADDLVDAQGKVNPEEVSLTSPCLWNDQRGRAKCEVLEQLGRGWHPIEDFYSHSNWTDQQVTEPSITNPPGLARTVPAPFFTIRDYSAMAEADWINAATTAIPSDLTTGCYPDFESTGVLADCTGRITHENVLKKDTPDTPRSRIDHNFDHAVSTATADITRQWNDFQAELRQRYTDKRGNAMICALTHDDPVRDCV
ncbi:hypothetical protein [Actinomadura roseirufa]|uniref:hypothetical protein n=1 Tax=Actinomadura roseirufa TaxID=2094049 RepID=UPI00104147FB|nr:hypothetical protein [Actinomadura roseirufa]